MNRLLLTLLLTANCCICLAQEKQERILYLVDSIPIIKEPKNEEQITEADIYDIQVITDEKKIMSLGHLFMDKLIYVTTKAYMQRPPEIKRLPTRPLMENKDGTFYVKTALKPYSGKFIDYSSTFTLQVS